MKLKSFICGLFVMAAAAACQEADPEVTPKLDVSASSVSLTATSAEASFTVTSNQKWTASADASWVNLNPSSGDASEKAVTVKVGAGDNPNTEARTATVTVKAGNLTKTVSVSQAAAEPKPEPEPEPEPDPILEVSAEEITAVAAGEDKTFTVTANNAWAVAVAEGCDWVTVNPASGEASEEAATVTVTVLANEVAEERTTTITVTSGELTKTVALTQAAAEIPEPEPEPEPTPMPEIPAGLVANTVWEDTFESKFWDSGIMALSNGYDWSARKAGEYLKITCAPTDPTADEWMVGLRNGDWQATEVFPEYYYKPEGGVVVELTQAVIDYLVANKGLIVQGNNTTITKIEIYSTEVIDDGGSAEPEIPADLVAVTLWEGSFDSGNWGGMQDLAYGKYDWSGSKPGQYLKFYFGPTDPSKQWLMGLRLGASSGWCSIESLPESYYQPEGGVVIVELTQTVIDQLAANNGLIVQGDNITLTKIELYRKGGNDVPESETLTNILKNSGFEEGSTGWMGWWNPTYTQAIGEGRNGGSAMELTLGECTNLWDAQILQDIAALESGVTYAYEFYAKTDAATALTVQMCAQNPTPPDYPGLYVFADHEVGSDWICCTGEFTYGGTPESITRIGIQFGAADSVGVKLWIDDFQFGPKK